MGVFRFSEITLEFIGNNQFELYAKVILHLEPQFLPRVRGV